MGDLVTLAATPAAILALVELAKRFGVEARWATLLAVVLGVGLAEADLFFGDVAAYQAAVDGLTLGLGAAGLWDVAGRLNPAKTMIQDFDEMDTEDIAE